MKPFNLERALAGDAVITRDGREVTQLTKFDCDDKYSLIGVVSGRRNSWTIDGQNCINTENAYDLFMKPKTVKVEGWIAIDKDGFITNVYKNAEQALKVLNYCNSAKAIFISEEIEVE